MRFGGQRPAGGFKARTIELTEGLRKLKRLAAVLALRGYHVHWTAALAILITWSVASALIWREWEEAVSRWKSTADITAVMAAEFSAKSIEATDLVLSSMIDWARESQVQTPADFDATFSSRSYFDRVRDRIAALPQVDVATFISVSGKVLLFSRSFPAPDISLADRDYFSEQSQASAPPSSLGKTVQNRGSGLWTFYKAKRVGKGDTLLGVVIAGIGAEYLSGFLSSDHAR